MVLQVDCCVVKRAAAIRASAVRPDDINLELDVGHGPLQPDSSIEVIGRARLTFMYNAQIVSALKQLHPAQRAWHAANKVGLDADLISTSHRNTHTYGG